MPEIDMGGELYIEWQKEQQEVEPADLELVMSYLNGMPTRSEPMPRLRAIEGLASAYSSRAEYDKAIAFLEDEINGTYDGKYAVWLRYLGGVVSEKMGNYKLAAKYYKKAILAYRKNDMRHIETIFNMQKCARLRYLLLNNLAFCYLYMRRFQRAERLCRGAIEINDQKYNAWKNLGVALEHQGKSKEAAEAYLTAVHNSGAEERSVKHMQRLLERNPTFMWEHAGSLHKEIAVHFAQMMRYDEAVHELQAALFYDPRDTITHLLLSQIYGRAKKYDDAIREAEIVLSINANYYIARYGLAEMLYQRGDFSKSAEEFQNFINRVPAGYQEECEKAVIRINEIKSLEQMESQL